MSAEAEAAEPEGESLLDGIRAKRKESIKKNRERRLDMELPSSGGALIVRYLAPAWEQAAGPVRRALNSDGGQEEIDASADLLARCCETILLRDEDGVLVPLNEAVEEFGDLPVRFDDELCQALKIEWTDARSTVLRAAEDDYAVVAQGTHLALWLSKIGDGESADF